MNSSLTIKASKDIVRIALSGLLAFALAACGGGGGSPGSVPGVTTTTTTTTTTLAPSATVGSISLVFSSPELKSSGAAGSEVTVTALVKSANNNALPDIKVDITPDSGLLASADLVSDANGQVKATLSTSGDPTNRKITVTAKAGEQTYTGSIDVAGTYVDMVVPATITSGGTGDITITVKNSADIAVANVPVSFTSSLGNTFVVSSSGGGTATAPLTNAQGQVVLRFTGSNSGTDVITVSSLGSSKAKSVVINASVLTVEMSDADGNLALEADTTTSCSRIDSRYEVSGVPQNGKANINASRGQLYSNSACSSALTTSEVLVTNGNTEPVYLKSDTAGVATVTASIVGGPSAQTSIEFIAELTSSATISLQAEPSVIGINAVGSVQLEKSVLTAVVRDGTPNNNFVKNAVVEFSVISDNSGGSLSNPSVATTAANGSGSVTFFAGAADTPTDGVVIQAKIQGTNTIATKTLTVARKSLFITAGTGSKIEVPTTITYGLDYVVFVTDASGGPAVGVTVTAAAIPTNYRKGTYVWGGDFWTPNIVATCENEDVNLNGILDPGEDVNDSGTLEPRIPLSVTPSAVTDAFGMATFTTRYPRDRANWTEIKLTFTASVSGTEAIYQTAPFFLPVLSSDVNSEDIDPPGNPSPYGVNICETEN